MKQIYTENAPGAVGPYSQAIIANGFVFCSGQIAIDPETGKLIEGDIAEQTHRVIRNLQAVLEASGSSLSKIVKTTCYLQNIGDFQTFNAVYKEYFDETKPARATIEVAKLPMGAVVEIEAIAEL